MTQIKPLGKQLDIVSIAADISSDATAIGSIATGVLADSGATASFDAEYARIDGTNNFTADLNMGNFNIINVVNVAGRNVATDGTTQDTHIADATLHRIINDAASAVTELWSASKISTELALKSDKVVAATNGNFAGLDATGNLTDSGSTTADFATAVHTHVATDITDFATAVTTQLNSNSIDELSDVDVTTSAPASGHALMFGTDWTPRLLVEADISDLQTYELAFAKNTAFNTDFGTLVGTTCEGNDVRLSDARTPVAHTHVEAEITDLQAYILDVTGDDLDALANVTITTNAVGELLKWDGAAWINNTLAEANISAIGHTHVEADITDLQAYILDVTGDDLDALANVTITANTSGEVLVWNGSAWINNTLAEAGISATGHTHVKADITDFNDADYATAAQGVLADSATQPGDNISTLTNDSGFAALATPLFTGTVGLPSYVLASLPAQATGHMIYVSDATGSSLTGSMCFSNGTVWIDVTTGAAVA